MSSVLSPSSDTLIEKAKEQGYLSFNDVASLTAALITEHSKEKKFKSPINHDTIREIAQRAERIKLEEMRPDQFNYFGATAALAKALLEYLGE